MSTGCGRILAPSLSKASNNLLHYKKYLSNHGNLMSITCCCAFVDLETFSRSSSEHSSRNRLNAGIKLIRMDAGRNNSSLTSKKGAKPADCRLCGVDFKIHSVLNVPSCHLSCQCSTTYGLTNSIVSSTNQVFPLLEQLRPWEAVRGSLCLRILTPRLLTPTALPTGILYSLQFRSH